MMMDADFQLQMFAGFLFLMIGLWIIGKAALIIFMKLAEKEDKKLGIENYVEQFNRTRYIK